MPKHLPFNSKYLQNFQVVEQREGNISRFPATRPPMTRLSGEPALPVQRADWKKDLQICVEGTRSRKRLTPVVGKKANGKYQII